MGTNEKQAKQNVEIINGYHVPKWSGKPPSGLHLDVMKDGKMIQKLMIDEKKCYFFGRNKDTCDFVIDHASCSRVHAVLLWHKDLNRSFIVDLNSTHGTFIGSLRLEGNKPQQVFVDSELKFGASTRSYIVREKPQLNKHAVNPSAILNNSSANNSIVDVLNESGTGLDKEDSFSLLTSLPESEVELDNLTEFNTAHNKRVAQLVEMTSASTISNPLPNLVKQKRKCVSFNEDEEVINPEDIDPTIGRFRNLIQTTIVIPNKRKKLDSGGSASVTMPHAIDITRKPTTSRLSLYDEEEEEEDRHKDDFESRFGLSSSVFSNLGVRALDIAPDVDEDDNEDHHRHQAAAEAESHHAIFQIHDVDQSGKKKYAKEAWPGRHPHAQFPSSSTVSASLISTAPETTAPTAAFNTTSATLGAKRLAI